MSGFGKSWESIAQGFQATGAQEGLTAHLQLTKPRRPGALRLVTERCVVAARVFHSDVSFCKGLVDAQVRTFLDCILDPGTCIEKRQESKHMHCAMNQLSIWRNIRLPSGRST